MINSLLMDFVVTRVFVEAWLFIVNLWYASLQFILRSIFFIDIIDYFSQI